jgi:hypothetical protein
MENIKMSKVIVQVLDLPAVEFDNIMGSDYDSIMDGKLYSANEIAEDVVWDFLQLGYLSASNVFSQYSVMVQIDEKKYNVDVQLVGCS